MVSLRKIQVHARVNQGGCAVVGGVDGYYVCSDPRCCSAIGPKRQDSCGSRAGRGTSIRNIVKWDISRRDRVVNLEGCIAAITGDIKCASITSAQSSQISAAEQGIGN